MTRHPDPPLAPTSEIDRVRASMEEAMERHDARQKWLRPIVWTLALVTVAGVIAAGALGVFSFSRSLSGPTGDPHGEILHDLITLVNEHLPSGAVVVSHRYSEPRWYSCNPPRYGAHFSDVQAQVVFRSVAIPAIIAPRGESLDAVGSTPLVWSTTVQLPGHADYPGENNIEEDITAHWKRIPGSNAREWTFDATSGAFGVPSGYCTGPS